MSIDTVFFEQCQLQNHDTKLKELQVLKVHMKGLKLLKSKHQYFHYNLSHFFSIQSTSKHSFICAQASLKLKYEVLNPNPDVQMYKGITVSI